MCWSYNPPLSFGNNESLDLSTQFPTASIVLLCTLLQKILLSRCRVFIFPGLRGYFPPRKKQSTLNSTMFFLPHVLPPFFLRFLFYKKNKRINCSCFTEICGYRTSQFHLSSGTNNDVQKSRPSAQNGRPHQKVHWWKPFLLEMDIPILGRFWMFRILVNIFYMWGICMIYTIHLDS